MGHTRESLYKYMERHPDTETGKLLVQLHDLFSNILAENGLRGTANNITAIFLLKALFGYKDTQTYELIHGATENAPSANEIIQRAGLLED